MPWDIVSDQCGLAVFNYPVNTINPRFVFGNLRDWYASRICLSRFGIKLNPIQSLSLGHCVLYGDSLSVNKPGQFFSKENMWSNKDNKYTFEYIYAREVNINVCFCLFYYFIIFWLIHSSFCHEEFKFHIFSPVCLEKACHLGLEVQFAKRLMVPLWQYNLMSVPASPQVILSSSAA